ncbi:hypothetical protein HAZT_HAZT007295 [Hyalella azteca]|uniref:Major facilitator superfamily (MFS) profile domain-containing protein n=1 Tax=Hyalella azteca TaxID=294128 RepID=A0A6A0H5D9_HYAAZ|nr:hypothetical protein HAZT_HAZT007295 [Hyalella azteca]
MRSILAGLGLVAASHPDDAARGCMIGRVQGGVALGVVMGYPMGGLLYHLTDSPAPPFVILAGAAAMLVGAMIRILEPYRDMQHELGSGPDQPGLLQLLLDPVVGVAGAAIMAATAVFPVLETCLPSHLRATVHPEVCSRWSG